MQNRCPIHQKVVEFYCVQPCQIQFCVDCTQFHKAHSIRNLVRINFYKMMQLNEIRIKHKEKIQEIQNVSWQWQGLFKEIDVQKMKEIEKIEKDFKEIVKAIEEKFTEVRSEICERANHRKSRLRKGLDALNKVKTNLENFESIIDMLSEEKIGTPLYETLEELWEKIGEVPEQPNCTFPSFSLLRNKEQVLENI